MGMIVAPGALPRREQEEEGIMPIQSYSILKGTPAAGRVVAGTSAHYQISVQVEETTYTAAVNIQSMDGSEVLYAIVQPFTPPDQGALAALSAGVTPVASETGGLALDYVRQEINGKPMITRQQMALLPKPSEDQIAARALENAVVALLDEAVADPGAAVYATGSAFAVNGVTDGIHDLHMNQGNPTAGGHSGDNGVWQDGAVFLNLPGRGSGATGWVAIFIAFQTEVWTTDAAGNPEETVHHHHDLEG